MGSEVQGSKVQGLFIRSQFSGGSFQKTEVRRQKTDDKTADEATYLLSVFCPLSSVC
jgi:hypothetical protein